jgi:ribosomal protein S18 acetylase RimI-like enzyme
MQKIIQSVRTSSSEFAKLIEDNLSAKSQDFAKLAGGQVHSGNPTWFTSGLKRAGYNGVTWAKFSDEQVDFEIKNVLEPFRQSGTPLTWWVGPLSQPGNLGQALQAHGFTHNRDMNGMAADLTQLIQFTPPKLEYTFEPINDLDGLRTWMPLFMETFGVPVSDGPFILDVFGQLSFSPDSDWRHYALRVDNEVVATSSLHLGAGVAGLYNIATHPRYRQNGLGTAITLLTYEQARGLGYQIGTLQTTYPNALRLYHRMGFEVYCKFGIYQRVW